MANKPINQLVAAGYVGPEDLFPFHQNGVAKKLKAQILENWLLAMADGHGGIHGIEKVSSAGLADTYRITLADATVFDFIVTNGRSITKLEKTRTEGLVDTYTISYNDGTSFDLTIRNGATGPKGDADRVHIKYASQQPTDASHSMGDVPDDWIGVYSGPLKEAPTDWKAYKWFEIKGKHGDPGQPAELVSAKTEYQIGTSGTVIPSGEWSASIPAVPQGRFLWARTTQTFNSGSPVVSYMVGRMGVDGAGSVSAVCNIGPDENGNVKLSAGDVKALPIGGGTMQGGIDMDGKKLVGLNDPVGPNEAANKAYVDDARFARNLLDNSDFTHMVNQRGVSGVISTAGYFIDRWKLVSGSVTVNAGSITLNGTIAQILETAPAAATAACDGGAAASYDRSTKTVTITGSGKVITWAALYEDSYTPESLPPYVPKGYATELAECQRYYIKYYNPGNANTWFCQAFADSPTTVRCFFPVSMRVKPTVQINDIRYLQITADASTVHTPTAASVYALYSNMIYVVFTVESAKRHDWSN